ncbi:MAG: hypothetical protein HKN45_10535 [Flavobacteriales bacterium]|nr:hypothetical protein [Flavobacteriales bacterium]
MSTTLTAFSWNYENTGHFSNSPLDEETILIEPDLDRIIIERNIPLDKRLKNKKSNSVEATDRAQVSLAKLETRNSTLRDLGNLKSTRRIDRHLISSSASSVKSYRELALHEMPYLRICGSLKDETERFQCTQSEMRKHIAEKFRIPSQDKLSSIPERFLVTFIIDEYGRIEKISPIDVIDPLLLEEVRHVFESMPEMVPAASSGRRIAVRFEIPIAIQRIKS